MFRKREKKIYPPGTFIPMPARICCIIQLCIAFTVLFWNLSQPFVGELFHAKSKLVLFQDVMGVTANSSQLSPQKQERLIRNAERFSSLPEEQKEGINQGLQILHEQIQSSFLDKLFRSFQFIFQMPLFEKTWLILSFIIPIMLLKRVEGALQAVWLLPLLAALYAFDNRLHGYTPHPSSDMRLFPTEEALVTKFMNEPLSDNVFEQQGQLQLAWKHYLVKEWTKEKIAADPEMIERQAEDGEFAFNLARLKFISQDLQEKDHSFGIIQEPLAILSLYIFWNILFASMASRYRSQPISV